MSYYLLHSIRIINDSIIEAISNQYVPIVKIINSTILTSQGKMERTTSLAWTIIREIICTNVLIYVFGILLGWGLIGVWTGLAAGKSIASVLNFLFAGYTIKKINEKMNVV